MCTACEDMYNIRFRLRGHLGNSGGLGRGRSLINNDRSVKTIDLEILEELKDGGVVVEVVVHNVEEVPVVHDVLDEDAAGRLGLKAVGPVDAEAESLVTPGEEGDALDNGGLNNLLAGEDTPGDGVGAIRGRVGLEVTVLGHGVVGERGVVADEADDLVDDLGRDEQLDVALLVDVTVGGTPAMDGVRRLDTVDGRLGVDGEEAALVKLNQRGLDGVGLAGEGGLTPGQRVNLLVQVTNKGVGNVAQRLGFTPLAAVGLVGAGQADAVGVELTKGRRARITPATVGELVPVLGAENVGLVAVAPEDGTDVLVATAKALGGLPGKGLLQRTLGGGGPAELLEDHAGGLGQVHGVKVHVVDTGGHELAAHLDNQVLANLTDGNIVVLDGLELVEPALGNLAAAVLDAAEEAGVGSNGHDARQNGNGDACGADLADPANEVFDVVEHLGDDEGAAEVDLVLEVLNQLVFVVVVVGALGVTGHTDIKVVTVGGTDVLDEIAGVLEAVLGGSPLLLGTGRVAAEGEDVGAAGLVGLVESVVDLFHAHVGAGQVHAGLETVHRLGLQDHLAGELGNASAGTPGDVDELGTKVVHAIHAVVEVLDTLSRLGREVFEGKGGRTRPFGLGEEILDVHGGWLCAEETMGVGVASKTGNGRWMVCNAGIG